MYLAQWLAALLAGVQRPAEEGRAAGWVGGRCLARDNNNFRGHTLSLDLPNNRRWKNMRYCTCKSDKRLKNNSLYKK